MINSTFSLEGSTFSANKFNIWNRTTKTNDMLIRQNIKCWNTNFKCWTSVSFPAGIYPWLIFLFFSMWNPWLMAHEPPWPVQFVSPRPSPFTELGPTSAFPRVYMDLAVGLPCLSCRSLSLLLSPMPFVRRRWALRGRLLPECISISPLHLLPLIDVSLSHRFGYFLRYGGSGLPSHSNYSSLTQIIP